MIKNTIIIIVLLLFVLEVVVLGQTFRSISSQAGLKLSECFFIVTLTLSSSTFYYDTDHKKCEITLGG